MNACRACWTIETNELLKKKIFCIGMTRAAKAGQKSLVPELRA
jgi:hypothetical protein